MKFLLRICAAILVFALIGGLAFGVYWLFTVGKTHEWAPINPPTSTASSSPTTASSTGAFVPSDVDTSTWKSSNLAELGYSISYPTDIITQNDGMSASFAFPKNNYFHWPLLDDAKVTVTVATTCPKILAGGPTDEQSQATTTMNDYTFVYSEGSDVGAGNIYREYAYDTVANGVCYHIDLLDHGTNGSGFYVDDQTLIRQYDAQHSADLAFVRSIFVAMVKTFAINRSK